MKTCTCINEAVQGVGLNSELWCHQVAALRRGLLSVVPRAVLDLLTWQELEKKICGDPEISVEALRRTSARSLSFVCRLSVVVFVCAHCVKARVFCQGA